MWIEDFRRDLRAALDEAKAEEDADPNHEIFDPPEGVSLQFGQTHATIIKRGTRS